MQLVLVEIGIRTYHIELSTLCVEDYILSVHTDHDA